MSSGPKKEESQADHLARKVKVIGLGHLEKHVFLCTGPKCCPEEEGIKSWDALKQGLSERAPQNPPTIARTKADCLRICQRGPVALVYPEGRWYHTVTPEVCQRLIDEDLLGDKVLTDHLLIENPLPEKK